METVKIGCDIQVYDIAIAQFSIGWNAVTDLIVDRRANTFGKSAVIQRGGQCVVLDNKLMAYLIEMVRCHTRLDVGLNHQKSLGRKLAGFAHQLDLIICLNMNHVRSQTPSRTYRPFSSCFLL